MSHIIQMKRQIKSIQTTKKLTHAMRLISMSLYSRLDRQKTKIEYFQNNVTSLFHKIMSNSKKKNKLFYGDILDANPLIIIVSSTKGFCGGLNENLFRFIEKNLFIEEHQEPNFIALGQKAKNFIEEEELGNIIESVTELNSNNFSIISEKITDLIIKKTPQFSSVTVYSNYLKNLFYQFPQKISLLPLKKDASSKKINAHEEFEEEIIWEQDKKDIEEFISNFYLNTSLKNTLFQALISEYAARFMAMDNATTNAKKYLENLTLQFNKLRQALITKEVCELSVNL